MLRGYKQRKPGIFWKTARAGNHYVKQFEPDGMTVHVFFHIYVGLKI